VAKNIKHRGLAVAFAVATLFVAQAASAAPPPVVQVGDQIKFADGNGASPGGAFILTDWGSSGTTNIGSFESFCVEKNEFINFNPGSSAVFNVSDISTEARKGGLGGSIGGPSGPHDPLDKRTAWLYTQYLENQSALSMDWNALTPFSKGTAMQSAIWSIEQEITPVTSGVAFGLISAAAAGSSSWADTGRVRVLNLTWYSGGGSSYTPGTYAQDQLYLTPVPEPETYAMMLAGLGLMGFIARRRMGRDAA
jgi:PEP-CTERM motif-containing protein